MNDALEPRTRNHALAKLWSYASPHHGTVVRATLYSILNKLFDLAPPILIGTAVDVMVEREHSLIARLGFPRLDTQLLMLAVATGLIWALESLFEYLYRVRWRNLAQAIQHSLRIDSYDHVQHLGMAYFENQSTGRLMSVLNDDINQLERFLDEGANDILQVCTTTVVIGGIFLYLAPGIGWMTILPMPLIAWGSIYFQTRLAPLYARVREQVGVLNGRLSNNLSGIGTIKSFTAETRELSNIELESDEYQRRNREAIRLSSAFVPVIRMIIVTGFIAILYFGGRMTLNRQLAVGSYSVMIFMTQRLLWPLTRLGSTLDLYQRGRLDRPCVPVAGHSARNQDGLTNPSRWQCSGNSYLRSRHLFVCGGRRRRLLLHAHCVDRRLVRGLLGTDRGYSRRDRLRKDHDCKAVTAILRRATRCHPYRWHRYPSDSY